VRVIASDPMDGSALTPGPRVFLYWPAYFMRDDRGTRALEAAGCTVVDTPEESDWVMIGFYKDVPAFAGRAPNILVLTDEPRYAIGAPRIRQYRGSMVHALDLSMGRFSDFWEAYLNLEPLPLRDPATERSGTIMLAGNQPKLAGQHAADMIGMRREIAEYGVTHGLLDLYGRGWDPLPTQGESRLGDEERTWAEIKVDLLSRHRFNIALENTYLPGYVSEKFWQAIEGGCLPVYLGSPWFDRLVDPGLYVDLRDHDSVESTFRALSEMPEDERIDRVRILQARLIELRAEVLPKTWDRWRDETARLLVDLHGQRSFTESVWAQSNAPSWTGWDSFPEDERVAVPRTNLVRRAARRVRRVMGG